MKQIINNFERILYNSLTHYIDNCSNKASSFKVILPEVYHDKFRELNDDQKVIISEFTNIFLNKISEIERQNNAVIDNNILKLDKEKSELFTKQNIMNYFIEIFGNYLNPQTDIVVDDQVPYFADIENNQIGVGKFYSLIGDKHKVYGLKTSVYIRISSDHIHYISEFRKKIKIGLGMIGASSKTVLYYNFGIFDGEIISMNSLFPDEVSEIFKKVI